MSLPNVQLSINNYSLHPRILMYGSEYIYTHKRVHACFSSPKNRIGPHSGRTHKYVSSCSWTAETRSIAPLLRHLVSLKLAPISISPGFPAPISLLVREGQGSEVVSELHDALGVRPPEVAGSVLGGSSRRSKGRSCEEKGRPTARPRGSGTPVGATVEG